MTYLKKSFKEIINRIVYIIKLKSFLILQIFIIFLYLYLFLNSVLIFPLNLLLGIICVLFLPGYNFLSLMFSQYNRIKKLGYMTIISLAIENIFMIGCYCFFYSRVTTLLKPGFVFNPSYLILSFQIINLILIIANEFKEIIKNKDKRKYRIPTYKPTCYLCNYYNRSTKLCSIHGYTRRLNSEWCKKWKLMESTKMSNDKSSLRNNKKKNYNKKLIFIFLIFILSLILMIISTIPDSRPFVMFPAIHQYYRQNFSFFRNVQPIFYLFLTLAILSFVFIIFTSKNKYLILISISLFFYFLWIITYIQINNYFGEDSYKLMLAYNYYLKRGLRAEVRNQNSIHSQYLVIRYSTSLFTAIILTSATGVNIDFALWYLYPLIFFFSPFFFYSVFQDFSSNKEKYRLNIVILTLFSLLTTQFLKCAHSATTMVIGIYIFLILIKEFFDLTNGKKLLFILKKCFFIIFLYLFLCLTHFEECIYFLIIIFVFGFYSTYFKIKETQFRIRKNNKISNFKDFSLKNIKISFLIINLLLMILIFILYLTLEFYGSIYRFFSEVTKEKEEITYIDIIYHFYKGGRVYRLPFFKDTFIISYFIIRVIILGISIWTLFSYIFLFKLKNFIQRIGKKTDTLLSSFFKILRKALSPKIIQFIIFPLIILLSFLIILYINFNYLEFLEYEGGFFLIVELILNYSLIIFHVFLFIKGFIKNEGDKYTKNYFFICLFTSFSMMIVSIIVGANYIAYHLLNSKIIPLFMILNLILIQNTYFKEFMEKKRKYIILLVIILLYLGVFVSLRKIGWE